MAATPLVGRLPSPGESLRRLLLQYLADITPRHFPGADGLSTDVVLRSYGRFAAGGVVPGPKELLRRHPEFTGEVEAFFASPDAA